MALPETLTAAFWVAALVAALLSTTILRLTVRIAARRADNGWDNALGYTLVTVLMVCVAGWLVASHHYVWLVLGLLLNGLAHLLALRVIYEIRTLHAALIGLIHATVTSAVIGAVTITAGFVAAIILKQRIIADPIYFIKLLLRLIGIELPFEA